MAKAVICPICNGTGGWIPPPPEGSSMVITTPFLCHGCAGKGWVEVTEDAPCPPYCSLEEVRRMIEAERSPETE